MSPQWKAVVICGPTSRRSTKLRVWKVGLVAVEKTGARIERDPEGPIEDLDLVLSGGEVDFRQLADFDWSSSGRAHREIQVALGDDVDAEVVPVLGEESDGMGFAVNSLVVGLRELLQESE